MAPLAPGRPAACLLALLSVVTALSLAAPGLAAGKTGQVTVFWGRNKAEGSLREACDSGMYTMVTMSFLDVFGAKGKYHLDLSGHDLSAVGADIKHCQSKGVPVSLSIGGYGTGYSLPSNRSALDLFDHLWNSYLGGIYEESDKACNQYGAWEEAWDRWTAAYPATRFFIGLTADEKSYQWIHPKNVYYGITPVVQKKDNYGGVMLWDRYFDKQSDYSSYIKYYA
ncbi:unnamed protein product [Triticum turgidum subsp. durum]|uniref:GH18 domain-containing protein n=1 Tax=Triticum turgidum subsp. durum TaxID=4567 RepID=A0A9R0XTC0_TRITD|nr:unnamed protein product [Triticum turgidum subsp. durum]